MKSTKQVLKSNKTKIKKQITDSVFNSVCIMKSTTQALKSNKTKIKKRLGFKLSVFMTVKESSVSIREKNVKSNRLNPLLHRYSFLLQQTTFENIETEEEIALATMFSKLSN